MQRFDISQCKIVEVEGLKIYVENDAVAERVKETLTRAEARKWYSPAAEQVIVFGKVSSKKGLVKLIAFDLDKVSPDADSEIHLPKNGPREIRISTLNVHRLEEKILHEMAHSETELGNPYRKSYTPEALVHKEKLRQALCEDFLAHQKKRDSFVPVQKEAAKLIFGYARQYPVAEHSAEHLCFGLQALTYSEKAAHSVAPKYTEAMKNYIAFEKGRNFQFDKSLPSSTSLSLRANKPQSAQPKASASVRVVKIPGVVYPSEILPAPTLPKAPKGITYNPDIIITPVNPYVELGKKLFRTGFTLYSIYSTGVEVSEHYKYLFDHDPQLYAETVAQVTGTQWGARCAFWYSLRQVNPYIGCLIQACSIYETLIPDTNAGYEAARAEFKPEDYNDPTIEQSDYNNIVYDNPFGPCQGLTPKKIKELGPAGVLALNPEIMGGQALEMPIRAIGKATNVPLDKMSEGVYAIADDTLQRNGHGKANPTEILNTAQQLEQARAQFTALATPLPKLENKGDILTKTLVPQAMPPQRSKPVFPLLSQQELNNPPVQVGSNGTFKEEPATRDYFPGYQPEKKFRKKIRDSIDPYQYYEPNLQIGTPPKTKKDFRFGFDIFGSSGGACGGYAYVKMNELTIEELVSLSLAGLFIGGILGGISYMYQKSKFEERLALLESQIGFISGEVKNISRSCIRALDKFIAYENAALNEDKHKLFKKAFKSFTRVQKYTEHLITKYNHLLEDKHAKLNVITLDPHSLAIRYFAKNKIKISHSGLPKRVEANLQAQIDHQIDVLAKQPMIYHCNSDKPLKETRKYMNDLMPELGQELEKLKNTFATLAIHGYHELTARLVELTARFDATVNNYKIGSLSKTDFDKLAIEYKDNITGLVGNLSLLAKWFNKGDEYHNKILTLLKLSKKELRQHNTIINLADDIRLANDCNAAANLFRAGLLNQDQFSVKVKELVGTDNIEKQLIWNNFITDKVALKSHNEKVNEFISGYAKYVSAKEKIAAVVESFKSGSIDKTQFNEEVEALLTDITELTALITSTDGYAGDTNLSDLGSYKHELDNDRAYYSVLVHATISSIFRSHIDEFNAITDKYRDNHNHHTDDYLNKVITEQEYIERCKGLLEEYNQSIDGVVKAINGHELYDDNIKSQLDDIRIKLPNNDNAQSQIIQVTLNELNALKKDADKAIVQSKLKNIHVHWQSIGDKAKYCYLLTIAGYAAFAHGEFDFAKQAATDAMALNATDFHALLLWIKADIELKVPTASTLETIDKYKSGFVETREQIILSCYVACLTDDVAQLDACYESAKLLEDKDERLAHMTMCHHKRESLIDPRRSLAMHITHSEAINLLEIDRWMELMVERLLKIDQIKQKLVDCKDDNEKEKLTNELKDNESLRNTALLSLMKQMDYEINEGKYTAINMTGYGHLATDVMLQLLSTRIKARFKLSDRRFQLVTQGITHLFNIVPSAIGNFMHRVSAFDIVQRAGLSLSQQAELENVLTANSQAGFVKSANQLLASMNTVVLGIKLASVISDYHLQFAYETAIKDLKIKPSFEDWLKQETRAMQRMATASRVAKVCTDTYTMTQIVTSLYVFVSESTNPLSIARRIASAYLNLPALQQLVHHVCFSSDGRVPTSRLFAFYSLLIENMYGSQAQQLFHLHEDTVLRGALDVLRRLGFVETATKVYLMSEHIHNGIYLLRSGFSIYKAIYGLDERVIALKVQHLREEFEVISKLLDNSKTEMDIADVHRRAALMYCDIKHAANMYIGAHVDAAKLYIIALFHQHLLDRSIELGVLNGDGNGLFKAVAAYTDQTPYALRKMCADTIRDDKDYLKGFIDDSFDNYLTAISKIETPADQICIYALTKALKRPIIVIFDQMSLNFGKQGLLHTGSIVVGKPIFVYFDGTNYHTLAMRGELYFEEQNTAIAPTDSTMAIMKCLGKTDANQDLKKKVKAGQDALAKLPDPQQFKRDNPNMQQRLAAAKAKLGNQPSPLFARKRAAKQADSPAKVEQKL